MKKDPQIFIEHILECIILIEKYTKNKNKKSFFDSKQLQDSVIRRVEVIGEATKNIPLKFRQKYPKIPWKEIAGMRDILIYEYFGVDLDLTWEVVKKDLPQLKKNILKIQKIFSK